ncbi:MAG: hypothetical protein BGO90_05395 [Legionella sp. 40-6]|mgnify:CR=1 FL=1|nr:MAG: hypothetical protein BGO90_05395 [Legionella sp. 40-6]
MANEINGLNELKAKFKKLQDINSLSFEELFPDDFIQQNTNTLSLNDFLKQSGFVINSNEDFLNIPDEEWEKYVIENTRFNSWVEMQKTAHEIWLKKWLDANNLS